MKPKYLEWLVDNGTITTNEGKTIKLIELKVSDEDEIMEEWGKRFRSNYCSEEEIDMFREGFGYSRTEYLNKIKFPDKKDKLGSATRSGDFCEILVADYVQFVLNYYVPRTRYDRKINRNSSPMGTDLFGLKIRSRSKVSQNDEMIIFEVKAQASEKAPENKLQKAVNDSNKDVKRIAESLNAANQRLIDKGCFEEAKIVQRFQNATDRPYKRKFAAAAVHSNTSLSRQILKRVSTASHNDPDCLLLVVHSEKLMSFIHTLYERASIC